MTPVAGAKVGEVTVNALLANLIAIFLTILLAAGAVTVAMLLPHAVPLGHLEVVWTLVGVFVVLSVHELTHALSLMVGSNVPWRAFKFGFSWRQFVLYCHCQQPMTLRAYRTCALAPLVVLGPATVVATLIYPAIWLAIVTAVHLAGCVGDVWILLRLRRFPDHFLVVDFPDRIGGAVFEPAAELVHSTDRGHMDIE